MTEPKFSGGYIVGGKRGLTFNLVNKPAWWHRFWVKLFLGWEWIDDDKKETSEA